MTTIRGLRGAVLAVVAMLPCVVSRGQGCLEPSALDLDAGAPPLTVTRDAGGGLALAWQDTGASLYHLYQGGMQAFAMPPFYDHVDVADPPTPSLTLAMPTGDRYFVVAAECSFGVGSTGRDSFGRERPPGGEVLVSLGLQGGAEIFAATLGLGHPAQTFADDADVSFVGPFAPGATGDPLSLSSQQPPGVVTAAATFQVFDPDPSFAPPAASSVTVVQVLFTFLGAQPTPADFTIVQCDLRDALANPVPGATCAITGFD